MRKMIGEGMKEGSGIMIIMMVCLKDGTKFQISLEAQMATSAPKK